MGVVQKVYSLELCNTTLSFLCSNDPWKCQGVNEILFQLLWVKAVQSFFCPLSSRVDEEPAEQGSASDPVPKGGWFSHSRYADRQTALLHRIWRTAFPAPLTSDRYCLIWQMLLFLGHGSINIGFKEEEFIAQCFLIGVFDSKDSWSKHQDGCFWRFLNSL